MGSGISTPAASGWLMEVELIAGASIVSNSAPDVDGSGRFAFSMGLSASESELG